METDARWKAPAWAAAIDRFTYLSQSFLGGPKVLKRAWLINLHKFMTIPVVLAMMAYWRNDSASS